MGFDTNYPNRKDHRRPYHKAGRHDATCRPGGSCPWCQSNRFRKAEQVMRDRARDEDASAHAEEITPGIM